MMKSVQTFRSMALARALSHQYPEHHGAARSLFSYSKFTTWFQNWFNGSTPAGSEKRPDDILNKKTEYPKGGREMQQAEEPSIQKKQQSQSKQMTVITSGGSNKPPDKIRTAYKSKDLHGNKTLEKSQVPAYPLSQTTQQPHYVHKLQRLPHHGCGNSWRTCRDKCGLICQRNDSLTGGVAKQPDEIRSARKSEVEMMKSKSLEKMRKLSIPRSANKHLSQNDHGTEPTFCESNKPPDTNSATWKSKDLQGTKMLEKSQEPAKSPSQATQQPHYEHKHQHLPHHGGGSNWHTCSDKCKLFCQWNDSLTAGLPKPTDEICAVKKSNTEKLKSNALENMQQLPGSETVSKHLRESDHESTCAGSNMPPDEIRADSETKDLQGTKTIEKSQEPSKPPNQPTQQPHYEDKFQHLPHHGGVSNRRTCSEKCELFCQWNDTDEMCAATKSDAEQLKRNAIEKIQELSRSLCGFKHLPQVDNVKEFILAGSNKPPDEVSPASKSNALQGSKTLEKSQEIADSPSQTTQQPHCEFSLQHLPHHGDVSNWRTCSDKCRLFCRWNDSFPGGSHKPPGEIQEVKSSDDLGGRAPVKTQQSPRSHTKPPLNTGQVMLLSMSPNLHKHSNSDSVLQQKRTVDEWESSPNELRDTKMVVKSGEKATEKIQQQIESSSGVTQPLKAQEACELHTVELVKQFPKYVHMLLQIRSETQNLTRRSISVSTLQQRHSYGDWDHPINKWRIIPHAKKSGSAHGDKPGGKVPEKTQKPTKPPEKTDSHTKMKFSRHVQMILGLGPYAKLQKKHHEKGQKGKGGK